MPLKLKKNMIQVPVVGAKERKSLSSPRGGGGGYSDIRHEKVQDFLIEHWHMIYIMPVVFAEIYL